MKQSGCGKAKALTPDQVQLMLDNAPSPKYRALWAVQYYTAARIGEALSLTWAQVTDGTITFRKGDTKTKQTRQPATHPRLQQELDRYRQWWEQEHGEVQMDHFLFHTSDSLTQPQTRQTADRALKRTAEALGIKGVSTHTFRRSAAQAVVNAGVPVFQAMAVTGHKSIQAFQQYLDFSAADLQTCHAVL